jgi:hypothetical protein
MIRLHPASRSHGAGRRQRPYVLGDRCGSLVQSGEGQLHLGLSAGCAQYPATVRVVDDVLQQRHLSHTGLSPQQKRLALARANGRHEVVQRPLPRRPISPTARTAEPRPISVDAAPAGPAMQAGQWPARSGGFVPTLVSLATNRFHGFTEPTRQDKIRMTERMLCGAYLGARTCRAPKPSSSRRTIVRRQIRLGTGTPEPSPAQLSLTGGSR